MDEPQKHLDQQPLVQEDSLAARARCAFIVKVYLLLTCQLTITFGLCLLSQFYQPYRAFQLNNLWVLVFPVVLLIASMVVAICSSKAKNYPYNMLLLLVFVLAFSYLISFGCSSVLEQIPGPTVIIAVAITIEIVIAITLYACLCEGNFVALCAIMIIVGTALFITSIVIKIEYSPLLIGVYSGLSALVYGIYLVILTKMVIGKDISGFPLDSPALSSHPFSCTFTLSNFFCRFQESWPQSIRKENDEQIIKKVIQAKYLGNIS